MILEDYITSPMEGTENQTVGSELILNVKKKRPKFKAGAELSSTVNAVDVGWMEEHTEDAVILTVNLHLAAKATSNEE